jgi:hypothetical protein
MNSGIKMHKYDAASEDVEIKSVNVAPQSIGIKSKSWLNCWKRCQAEKNIFVGLE